MLLVYNGSCVICGVLTCVDLCLYVHCSYTFGVPMYLALFLCVVCHCDMSIAVHIHVVLLLHVVFVVNIWWPIGYDGRLLCVLLFFAVPHGLFHFPASMLTFVLLACVLQTIACWWLVDWCVVAWILWLMCRINLSTCCPLFCQCMCYICYIMFGYMSFRVFILSSFSFLHISGKVWSIG